MDFEFETKRTALANAFAEAGAKLLDYQPLVSTAVAMIPGASPQKYAVAGTLKGILSMAGKMMGEEGNLTDEQIIELHDSMFPAVLFERDKIMGNVVRFARAAIAACQSQQVAPDGFVLVPRFRGYACLGIGAYVINHSAKGEPAELVISVATDKEKAGRTVGDSRNNAPGAMVQPEAMAVRLRFENVAGLDALEQQLRFVRSVHFPESMTQNADLLLALQKAACLLRAAGFAMTGTATSQIMAAINSAAVCTVSPSGWQCTRAAGHDGPCAAIPADISAQNAEAIRNQAYAKCIEIADAERAEFISKAGDNNGRESDFAFGSVNSAERIAAAIRDLQTGSANTQEVGE
jgi:hypothetical protein